MDEGGSEARQRRWRWSPVGALARWTAGVLAAVVATVVAGLILNAVSDSRETVLVQSVEQAELNDTGPEEAAVEPTDTGPEEGTAEPTDTEPEGQLLLTSYIWEEATGWTEHASWVSGTTDTSFVPVLSAWNWPPDYPALTVRFDDFMTLDSGDNFETEPLSTVWQVDKIGEEGLVRGAAAKSTGVTAEVVDRQLVVRLAEGESTSGFEKRVDLFHGINLEREFDVSVRFTLEDGFYSLTSGGLSLTIVCTVCPEGFQAGITLLGNSYQSYDSAGSGSRTLAGTPADQLDGGLRLRGTKVEP